MCQSGEDEMKRKREASANGRVAGLTPGATLPYIL